MSLLNKSAVLRRAKREASSEFSAKRVLNERMQSQASVAGHDIFLSHAFDDKELILGVALTLEDLGYSVYLDWRDDPTLDRKNVNQSTALKLRDRMKKSKCLLFATTQNTSGSKWMPWELGYKDGENSRSAILPVKESRPDNYKGQEYLGIYPYVTQQKSSSKKERLWVRRSATSYVVFDSWLKGEQPFAH